ncbi:hypothetical protein [Streptomyces griseoviridis]|uniref:hypothetical protein n=1 Tax=Streptomyces griseoviridis TaxID=45398 RepID=UPI00341EEEBE
MSPTGFAPHGRALPPGDAEILRDLRGGHGSLLALLHQRHRGAALAYASTCTPSPDLADSLVTGAFTRLRDRVASPRRLDEGRHAGCVRLQLLESVRLDAVTAAVRAPGSFHRPFVDWLRDGAVWPLAQDDRWTLAYETLPAGPRCLLWHSLVERDDTPALAAISGLAPADLTIALRRAEQALRHSRSALHTERLDGADCAPFLDHLTRRPDAPLSPPVVEHLRGCRRCRAVHEELGELPARAARHLPPRLLGWWPSEEYARAKARRRAPGPLATVTPLVPRASARTGTRSGATPAARHRRARCGRWCALVLRTVRRMAWRAVVLVLVAGAVVGGLLAEHTTDRWSAGGGGATAPAQDPRAPLRVDRPIAADRFASAQGTLEFPTDAPGARRLPDGASLVYERVRFGGRDLDRLIAEVARVTRRPARLEFRLGGGPRDELWTTMALSAGQRPHAVAAGVRPLTGRHDLRVTARCAGAGSCAELFSFHLATG